MNPGQRSVRPLARLLLHPPARSTPVLLRNAHYSTATASATSTTTDHTPPIAPSSAEDVSPAKAAPAPADRLIISSSVVLSRPPFLTRMPDAFESSFYFYQSRLNQRLALPWTRYFYFKKSTPADIERKRKQLILDAEYRPFGPNAWRDELLLGDKRFQYDDNGYQRLVDTTVSGEEAEEGQEPKEKPLGRETEADRKGDRRSLDRKGERTVYLVTKKGGEWRFPRSAVKNRREDLRETAERTLAEAAGVNMNTWFVGNVPIGHWNIKASNTGDVVEKVFFMKARIMAGQADLGAGTMGLEDYLWLTKEELEDVVGKGYYNAVKNMLVSR